MLADFLSSMLTCAACYYYFTKLKIEPTSKKPDHLAGSCNLKKSLVFRCFLGFKSIQKP